MMKSLSLPVALLLASSLLFAACGGDEETTPGSDTGTTEDTGGSDTASPDAAPGEDTSTADTGTDIGGESDAGPEVVPTFADLSTSLFEPSCGGVGCHLNGGNEAPVLDAADAYDQLLGFAEGADLNYVVPGSLEESYLWHKAKGTHRSVGGSGSSMPLGGSLSEEQIGLLEAWILGGAPE
jgi:hypothetical protein